MSAKKKNQQTSVLKKLNPLWQKYSVYICGGLLILLLIFSFLLWYKTVHAPAAVADTIRQNVEKFAAGDGTAVFEVLTVTDRNASLKMESPELDLEDVVLLYSPEGINAGKIDDISIGRVRIKGDFRTACRKLLELRKHRSLRMAGNVTIREIVYGEHSFKDLVMSLDTLKGTLDGGTEIAYDPDKNQLQLKNNVFFVPEMFFTEAEWKLIPHFMYFFRLPSGEDSFRAQELVMDLTETVHPFKRIVKLQAENLVDSYHLDADPVSRWADSIRYDAQTGALEVIYYNRHPRRSGVKKTKRKPHTILNATLNADDGVTFREKEFDTQDGSLEYRYEGKIDKTGKVDAKGRVRRLGGILAQEYISEFGDGPAKDTFKQYAFSTPDFTARIPEFVLTIVPGSNDYSFKNAELTFHGIPFTAKDIFVDWNSKGNGTFTIGTVCENGRKIGSISSGKRDSKGFTGKAQFYGLDGTLNGKLLPVAVRPPRNWEAWKWEYTITFPRQQIKNAGRDLLPANSPVRLQGFAALKMDHKGLFDLVIDNGELDLAPVKLSNFSLSTGTQTFAFDGIDFCGIKFGKGQGKYHLENGKLRLDGVTFDWCGGKGKLLPQLENGRYLLDCSDLLLSELFKALEIGVFEGAGRVSGRIPLKVAEDGTLTLDKMAFYSVPGASETLKGTLHENYKSGDPAYTFVADVMRNMKYDWVRLDLDPVPENGKYTLRISFRGKPGQPMNYEIAPGADGSASIRQSGTARNFGYLNLSLNLSLNLDPEKVRNAVRNLHR